MEKCELKHSEFDPCLFIGEKVTVITYVDDLIFWARDEVDIHAVAMLLRELGVDLEQEDDAAGFLGVMMQKYDLTGLLDCTQRANAYSECITLTQLKASYCLFLHSQIQ